MYTYDFEFTHSHNMHFLFLNTQILETSIRHYKGFTDDLVLCDQSIVHSVQFRKA